MNSSKIVISLGSLCATSACGVGSYFIIKSSSSKNNLQEDKKLQIKSKNFKGILIFQIENLTETLTKYYLEIYKSSLLTNDEYTKKKENGDFKSNIDEDDDLREFLIFEITEPINKEEAEKFLEKLSLKESPEISLPAKENLNKKLSETKDEFEKIFGKNLYKKIINDINSFNSMIN